MGVAMTVCKGEDKRNRRGRLVTVNVVVPFKAWATFQAVDSGTAYTMPKLTQKAGAVTFERCLARRRLANG